MTNLSESPRDEELWEVAKKRAGFKRHLAAYIIINAFLWAMWLFNGHHYKMDYNMNIPWPLWTTLGWGFGLAFHFVGAYVFSDHKQTEKEYKN